MMEVERVRELAATALVAACRINGVAPETVFEDGDGGGMTRVLAAATCVDRLGWDKRFAAGVFRINRKRLTPSGLRIARVDHGDVAVVGEALAATNGVRPKPLNDRIVRLARMQVAVGAPVAEVADLFDVDAGELTRVLDSMGVAA